MLSAKQHGVTRCQAGRLHYADGLFWENWIYQIAQVSVINLRCHQKCIKSNKQLKEKELDALISSVSRKLVTFYTWK